MENPHDPRLDHLLNDSDIRDFVVENFRRQARDANLLEAVDESFARWGIPIRKQVEIIFGLVFMEIKEVKDK